MKKSLKTNGVMAIKIPILTSATGRYRGVPAVLSEVAWAAGQSVFGAWWNLGWPKPMQFWILGNSFDKINILSNEGVRCDINSCYDKCLSKNEICKQG